MIRVTGTIETTHRHPACIAGALRVDNLSSMTTEVTGDRVKTTITGTKLRSVIASADDYLTNLSIAEEACRYKQDTAEQSGNETRPSRGQRTTTSSR